MGPKVRCSRSIRVRGFHQKYLKYRFREHYIDIPAIRVRIYSPDNWSSRTIALVDSGATTSFIPTEMANVFNLPVIDQSEATGAGGDFTTWTTKVNIDILKGQQIIHNMEIDAQVPDNPEAVPYIILGRDCIFKLYDITFREEVKRTIFRNPKGKQE